MIKSLHIPITVVIPTYDREQVLLETICYLLRQIPTAAEILVVDQTRNHNPVTEAKLAEWDRQQIIRWIRLEKPSIAAAMNMGLSEASSPIVLFVDDDIVPVQGFIKVHARSYKDPSIWAVSGQIIQPNQNPVDLACNVVKAGLRAYVDFPFNSERPEFIQNVMAGNLSVRRERAIEIGGFDENFIGVAYRFETEFARRIIRYGGRILYQPEASINHLRIEHGGTRSGGGHMASISPIHGVGDYYFALSQGLNLESIIYILKRPFREIRTRFHFRNPWWIPVKFIGELRAICLALILYSRGPRYICKAKRN